MHAAPKLFQSYEVDDDMTRRKSDDGASSVEYGLIAVAIAALIVVTVFALGGVTHGMFAESCSEMASAATSSTC